ncbi:MAG: hypothetical protein QXK47_04615, partial [Candidatus Bathyarchaeia archaeon]
SSIAFFQAGRSERAEKAGTAKGVQEFGALELAEPLDLVLLVLEEAAFHLILRTDPGLAANPHPWSATG